MTKTITVVMPVSFWEGQVTLDASDLTCCRKSNGLVFAMEPLTYNNARNSISRVHKILTTYNILPCKIKCEMAGAEGLEPPTLGFGDRCSTS